MSFTRSSARRRVLRITGVLTGVVMVAGGAPAYAFAAQGGSGQHVSAQSVPGKPPAGLQEVANQMAAAGAPGVIIMSRNGRQVSHVVAGVVTQPDRLGGRGMKPLVRRT